MSEGIDQVKTDERKALAEPDVAGERDLTAKLRWTFREE